MADFSCQEQLPIDNIELRIFNANEVFMQSDYASSKLLSFCHMQLVMLLFPKIHSGQFLLPISLKCLDIIRKETGIELVLGQRYSRKGQQKKRCVLQTKESQTQWHGLLMKNISWFNPDWKARSSVVYSCLGAMSAVSNIHRLYLDRIVALCISIAVLLHS